MSKKAFGLLLALCLTLCVSMSIFASEQDGYMYFGEGSITDVYFEEIRNFYELEMWLSRHSVSEEYATELRQIVQNGEYLKLAVTSASDSRARFINHVAWRVTGHHTRQANMTVHNLSFSSLHVTGRMTLFYETLEMEVGQRRLNFSIGILGTHFEPPVHTVGGHIWDGGSMLVTHDGQTFHLIF